MALGSLLFTWDVLTYNRRNGSIIQYNTAQLVNRCDAMCITITSSPASLGKGQCDHVESGVRICVLFIISTYNMVECRSSEQKLIVLGVDSSLRSYKTLETDTS